MINIYFYQLVLDRWALKKKLEAKYQMRTYKMRQKRKKAIEGIDRGYSIVSTTGNGFWSWLEVAFAMSWLSLSTFCFSSSIYLDASTIIDVWFSCHTDMHKQKNCTVRYAVLHALPS